MHFEKFCLELLSRHGVMCVTRTLCVLEVTGMSIARSSVSEFSSRRWALEVGASLTGSEPKARRAAEAGSMWAQEPS